MNLKILWMYHDLMDLYGDKGNAEVLRRRAEKRGITVTLDTCTIGEKSTLMIMICFSWVAVLTVSRI